MLRLLITTALVLAATGPVRAEDGPRPRPAPAALCGTAALVGEVLPPIAGEGTCGVAAPVRLAAAAGVALDPPATVDCAVATALATWLRRGPKTTFAALGLRLDAVTVVDAYSCRNRNRAASGKLSEHAFGRAIDISGFQLSDGTTLSVAEGWTAPGAGPALRRVHAAGCGPFATVLGPDANPLHADHLHFDMAHRRSGPWCE